MQRRRVGVVQHVDVVLADARIFGEVGQDVLHRLGGARQMMEKPDAADRESAVGAVERHHHVVALVGHGRARHVFQRDDRFLDHLVQPVPDDLERDRVDRNAHWRTFKNEIRDGPRFSDGKKTWSVPDLEPE